VLSQPDILAVLNLNPESSPPPIREKNHVIHGVLKLMFTQSADIAFFT